LDSWLAFDFAADSNVPRQRCSGRGGLRLLLSVARAAPLPPQPFVTRCGSCSRCRAVAAVQAFCELVDDLVETHLSEIGITAEEFVEICAKARHGRQENRAVIEQLLAVEDFLSEWLHATHVCVRGCRRRYLGVSPALHPPLLHPVFTSCVLVLVFVTGVRCRCGASSVQEDDGKAESGA
jgi:hypothetical protein